MYAVDNMPLIASGILRMERSGRLWPSSDGFTMRAKVIDRFHSRFGLLRTTRTKMKHLFAKKPKKSPKPPRQNIALGIPTNIAVGPLGFRADFDIETEGDSIGIYE